MRRSSDLNRPVLRMSVLSMLSRACHRGCQCIPGLCSGYCRTWVSVVPAMIPPDLPGSGCLYSTGALARRLPRSPITAHCSQEAVLCPLGDFHVHIDFNPDLITAQATFEPALRSKKRRGKKTPDTFSLAFLKILNNVHIIYCLKWQSLAAKHISSRCGMGGVATPAYGCHLHPLLHPKLHPIKWAHTNISVVAYAGACRMYFCIPAVHLAKTLFSPSCYFQELTSGFL